MNRLLRYMQVLGGRFVTCLMLFLLIASSCDQRDPQAEYELLRQTVYSNPQEGIDAAQEYIDHFYNKSGARITEVSSIRDEYRRMADFVEHSFNSYADFLDQSREINAELSSSNYEGVRKTWQSLYERERNQVLGPIMDSITESSFDEFFKTQVRLLCEDEFNVWDIEEIDKISLTSPTLSDDGTVKKASGEYRIHLRGNVLGLITRDARVSIEGTIGPDESGYIQMNRTGYHFLEKPTLP